MWGQEETTVSAHADSFQYQPGQVIGGRFHLERQIGKGGFAVVWRCRMDFGARKVALKLPHSLHPDPDRDINEEFLKEGKRMRALFHRNIVPVYSHGWHGKLVYIAFKLVEGETLAARIKRTDHRIWATEARSIAWHIASALAYAHRQGLIHRDLKPSNVLLDPGGWVYLTDFGIALTLDEAADGARATGTRFYMAPEQLAGAPLDPRCDVYSFGVILYQLLTGQLPARPEASYADPALAYFCPLLRKCLAPDPQDRYPSGRQLLSDLRELMPPGTVPVSPADRPPDPPQPVVVVPPPELPRPPRAMPARDGSPTGAVRRRAAVWGALFAFVLAAVGLAAVGAAALIGTGRDVRPMPAVIAVVATSLGFGFAVVRPQRAILGFVVAAAIGLALAALLGGAADSLLRSAAEIINTSIRLP